MVGNYSADIPCRWKNYGTYRMLVLMLMLNEISLVIAPSEISHGSFYMRTIFYIITIIFLAIPIIYSEMCIAQYNNSTLISMWNFFPIFRGLGHGMIFNIILRIIYLNVLTSWYLIYSFHSALDPPPWYSCAYFKEHATKCMVKRENTSLFQYCLISQEDEDDCDYYTASYWFFETVIRIYNTHDSSSTCFYPWKTMLACASINFTIFVLAIKKEKYLQIGVKLAIAYIAAVIIVLFCVSLSRKGGWLSQRDTFKWRSYTLERCLAPMNRGFLSLGAGTGIILHLSRDAHFRSPATMTVVFASLFGAAACVLLSLIVYSGINTMTYYHAQEETVLEMCDSAFFQEFGSISEILTYFDAKPLWGFLWYSAIFFCLCMNLWILHGFVVELLSSNTHFAKRYGNSSRFILKCFMFLLTLPFFCSDLYEALMDVIELTQLFTSFCFSLSLYWIYGFNKHSVDITFMIGVKIGCYWKIAWMLNPVFVVFCMYSKVIQMRSKQRFVTSSYKIKSLQITYNQIMIYFLLGTYAATLIVGTVFELITYKFYTLRSLWVPSQTWGPRDSILSKSRHMFMPAIMTREFLYRQVRMGGYREINKIVNKKRKETHRHPSQDSIAKEWSPLTSN